MNLWKFKIRSLSVIYSERGARIFYVLLKATNEKDAVKELKQHKFTDRWWEEHLILDVESLDEIWFIQDIKEG